MRLPFRRHRLSRSPLLFWVAVAALALTTASVVSGAINQARALAARYGPLRSMVVAARPVDRGTELASADVTVRSVPASFLADGMVRSVDEVVGRAVVVPLVPGQPLFGGQLAPEGLSGVAALLPIGTRAVSVPTGSAAPPLRRGDVVEVLATVEGRATLAVATDAGVLDVGTEVATVAVSPEEARAVAYALAHGSVTVTLTPGSPAAPSSGVRQRNDVASNTSTAAPASTR